MIQFKCPKCGQEFSLPQAANQVTCPMCGEKFNVAVTIPPQQQQFGPQQQPQFGPQQQYAYGQNRDNLFDNGPSGKSRGVAGLLAILLGGLGVHYFYLGNTTAGIISLILGFVTCGIWALVMVIQGVIMLTMNQQDFEQKYVYTNSTLPLF